MDDVLTKEERAFVGDAQADIGGLCDESAMSIVARVQGLLCIVDRLTTDLAQAREQLAKAHECLGAVMAEIPSVDGLTPPESARRLREQLAAASRPEVVLAEAESLLRSGNVRRVELCYKPGRFPVYLDVLHGEVTMCDDKHGDSLSEAYAKLGGG